MKRWAIKTAWLAAVGIGLGCASCHWQSKDRVLLLGIDGATWKIIDPMMAAGQLPHIKKLYDEGLHGILESRPPILSPVVWTTIFTGFNYQTHGVKDWKTSQSTNRRVSAIWNITQQQHKKTNVFNVPGSWPPEPVSGVMLSGFPLSGSTFSGNTGEVLAGDKLEAGRVMTPYRDNLDAIKSRVAALADGQWTPWFEGTVASRPDFKGMMRAMRLGADRIYVSPLYRTDDGIVMSEPADLRGKISERLGEPYIPEGPGWSRWEDADTPVYLYQHLKQIFDIQTRAALLYAAGDWDLSLYVMTLVDRVSHPYWAYSHPDDYPGIDREKAKIYETAVADAYRASDEALGKILDAATGNFRVVVVSDHGFASYEDKTKQVGAHNPDGIYMVWGPGIKPANGQRTYIEDITPTLLYMLGLPVGQDMDGKPIAEVTADLGRPLETLATYERDERNANDVPVDDATWEQLRGLGYVDGAAPREQIQQREREQQQRQQGAAAPDRTQMQQRQQQPQQLPNGTQPQQRQQQQQSPDAAAVPDAAHMQQRQQQPGGAVPDAGRAVPRLGSQAGRRPSPPDGQPLPRPASPQTGRAAPHDPPAGPPPPADAPGPAQQQLRR